MNFIKKYYPMLISILFHFICSLYISTTFSGNDYLFSDSPVTNLLAILFLLLYVVIFVEMIGFIIHAAKNNNGMWGLWIYLFNVLIIPYYNLKYVIKEEKINNKMIVYVFLLIYSMIIGVGVSVIYS